MRAHWFDDRPGKRPGVPPLGTWSGSSLLVALLAVVFLLEITLGVDALLALRLQEAGNPLFWYQFLTYALVHSRYDLMHLLMNCLVLVFFARQVEAELGGRRPFFMFCGAAAILASLSFVVVELLRSGGGHEVVLLGASGIAYACLAAYGTLFPNAQVVFFIFPMRAWALVALLMGLALYSTLMGSGRGVAHVAHLAGGAFGFLFIRYRHLWDRLWWRYQGSRAARRLRQAVERRRELDRLLEKISRSGLTSLTRDERRFLESASRDLREKR